MNAKDVLRLAVDQQEPNRFNPTAIANDIDKEAPLYSLLIIAGRKLDFHLTQVLLVKMQMRD